MTNKNIDLVIWGTKYSLPIEYSDSIGSNFIATAEQSVLLFVDKTSEITESAKIVVESYIQKSALAIGIAEPDSLIDCVEPQMLLVRVDDDGSVNIALLCGFKYDPEHDIAIVYKNEELVEVGSQDIVVWW